MTHRKLIVVLTTAIALLIGYSAAATTMGYTDVVGTSVSYTGIQETSTSDLPPLFGQPLGLGNQLLFFPANFKATASGAAGYDETSSLLNMTIAGNGPLDTITTFSITEYGDANLGGTGTAATGTYAAMAGFLTVTHDVNGAIVPVVIPILGVFSPTGADFLDLVSNPGTTLWSATQTIDVSAYVTDATQAILQLDNNLYAYSEDGTSALIQKKVVSGPAVVIEVVPEPGTGLLVAGGLLGLAIRSRRGRA